MTDKIKPLQQASEAQPEPADFDTWLKEQFEYKNWYYREGGSGGMAVPFARKAWNAGFAKCEDSQAGQCWKCGDADPDFQGKCEAQPALSLKPDRLHIAAMDLARKQSGALIELETMNTHLRQQNTAIDEACAKLEAANSELLRSLEEMKMWISIAVELACLDPKTTEVEFEFENGSPPKTISIYSSMQLANAAIEKNKSKS